MVALSIADPDIAARFSCSMKAKSSAPMEGGMDRLTLSDPTMCSVTSAQKAASAAWLIVGGYLRWKWNSAVQFRARLVCSVISAIRLFDEVERIIGKSAYGAAQLCVVGNDIVGRPGMDLRDADDGGLERVEVAGDDGLEALGKCYGGHDGVMAKMRHGAVATLALESNFEGVA